MSPVLIVACFFLVAFLYASVGHGGASGYLAVMALLGMTPAEIRPTALVLNLIVSLVATLFFFRSGHFRSRLFLPLAMASVPASWLGAHFQLSDEAYRIVLGVCLLIAVFRLVFETIFRQYQSIRSVSNMTLFVLGAGIGLLSGMIGIGGGILLSPILLLARWADMRESAALSAPFIFVNSLAALIALSSRTPDFPAQLFWWLPATLAGGFAGGYLGSRKLPVVSLKYILAAVLVIAAGKLILV